MLNGMRADRSWARAGREYVNVYEDVRHNDAAGVPAKLDEMRPRDAVDWVPDVRESRGAHHAEATRT